MNDKELYLFLLDRTEVHLEDGDCDSFVVVAGSVEEASIYYPPCDGHPAGYKAWTWDTLPEEYKEWHIWSHEFSVRLIGTARPGLESGQVFSPAYV